MNRSEFARAVADRMKENYPDVGISYADAKIWTVTVLDSLVDQIVDGQDIVLVNFGTFKTKKSSSRRHKDIKCGGIVTDPPRMRIKFTPADSLDKKVAELPVKD